MSDIAEKMLTLKNKAIAAGERILPHAKPLALGFAAALGISAVLSSPKESIGPMEPPPPARLRSGSGGSNIPTNLHPDSGIRGAPTAEPMTSNTNTSRVSPAANGMRIEVNGRGPSGGSYGSLNSQMRFGLGRANVHSDVSDDRMSLNQQKLSDILNRR